MDCDVPISRSRSVIDVWKLLNSKSVAVRLVVGKVVLVRVFFKNTSFFPTISALFHLFSPLTCVHLPLVLHKVSSWKHEDIYILIYTQILYSPLCIKNSCLSL